MNQSESLTITCDLLKARQKSRLQGATDFSFAPHSLKNWRETFKPITKRSNRNRVSAAFLNCSNHATAMWSQINLRRWY